MIIFKTFRGGWMLHLLNRLSIYKCPYLARCTTEHWLGFRRRRVLKVGRITVWVRASQKRT
jgi:hypothetical protein